MKFLRLSAYAEESECKLYTVSAAKVQGRWTFQGWRRPTLVEDIATLLTPTRLMIAEDARSACAKDAKSITAQARKARAEAA